MDSIGVDIESVERFRKALGNLQFLNNIFTKPELDYCLSKPDPSQHLAARFAAKEAVIKALSKPMHPKQIEVLNNKQGKPLIKLKDYEVMLSLSHTKENAIAFVMLKSNDKR